MVSRSVVFSDDTVESQRSVVFSDNTVESQRCHNQQLQWWRDGVPVGSV